jgi:hypothetical protein
VRAPSAPRGTLAPFAPASAFLVLALAWSWPLPLYLSNRFPHDPGDPLLVTFLLWWNARVLPLSEAMWNAPFFWPMRGALALTEHGAGMGVVTTPIQWLGGSPLLAYNVLLITSVWAAGLATYALVRRLTGSAAAGFCAGVAFAFAPYRASQLSHLQMLVTWWMPLALLALHRYYDASDAGEGRRPRTAWLAVFGASWLLQALTNGYYLFYFPVLIALWMVVFTSWRRAPRRALAVSAAWMVSSLPLIPVLLKYYGVQTSMGLERTRTEIQLYSASIDSFLHAPQLLRFWRLSDGLTTEDRLFPGVTVLAAIGAGLLVHRWRGREARLLFFYLAAAVLTASLTLGWLPVFPGVRVPARFFMLTTLCLAIAAGLAVAAMNATYPRYATWVTCLVATGLLADGWIAAMPLGAPPRPFATPLAKNAVVLEVPVTDAYVNIAAMYRGTLHGLPVVNGYAGYVPPTASIVDWALVRKDPSILTELRRGRTLYVVVAIHPESPTWSAFIGAQNDVKRIEIGGGGTVYELPPAPFARQVTIGPAIAATGVRRNDGWLTVDLGAERTVRAVELRTRGHVVLLNATLRVETSADGNTWTMAAEDPTGGLAFAGSLRDPRRIPVRVVLPDARARFVRLNTPAFTAADVSVHGPA